MLGSAATVGGIKREMPLSNYVSIHCRLNSRNVYLGSAVPITVMAWAAAVLPKAKIATAT
jgi:hypothetical protein